VANHRGQLVDLARYYRTDIKKGSGAAWIAVFSKLVLLGNKDYL
jgi:hypothetical protein